MTGDITLIDNIWPVMALVVVMGVPSLFAWLNSRQAKEHARRGANEIEHQANPNSGASMKDSLNRIETTVKDIKHEQAAVKGRLDIVEAIAKEHGVYPKENPDG